LLEVKDGEQLLLGGKRNKEGECERHAQQSDPKGGNSARMRKITDQQGTQVNPLRKREGGQSLESEERPFRQKNRERARECQGWRRPAAVSQEMTKHVTAGRVAH
jgi:hypothetical protein